MTVSLKNLLVHGRQSSSVIIGVCIGIALSLIQTPFLEDQCIGQSSTFRGGHSLAGPRLANLRDLRSDGLSSDEDYEPRLVLDSNDYEKDEVAKATKSQQKLLRPRYYSTELGIRGKLLVAVLSSRETISSFGVAVNKTLNHHVDKIIFFLDGIGSKKLGLDIPVVGFKDEKPLIKVFRVISYLDENYPNDYDFFMVVSDRTYIHGRKLYKMVKKLSISENIHLGMLMDHPESLYCSIDGGIILSHSVLHAVASKLNWCTRNTFSETDTDNLGRCILHSTDKPCVSSLQGQRYNSYRLHEDVDVVSHLQLIGGSAVVKEALTVSNIPEANDIHVLHMFYLQDDLRSINKSILESREQIQIVHPLWSNTAGNMIWPVGSAPAHNPATRFDVIRWETFNATHMFLPDDFQNTKPIVGADLQDIMGVLNASISYMHTKTKGNLEYRALEYGHRRLDPTRGVDYIFSIIFRDNLSGQIVSRKLKANRPLVEPEILPMPYVTENNRITIFLVISQAELLEAVDFVKRYEKECMASGEHTFLLLALMYSPGSASTVDAADVYKPIKDLALKYTREHQDGGSKVGWVSIHMSGSHHSQFAITDLMVKKLPEDSLILLTKHSAHINNDFLNRVRMNTILNWQVFSAVPFAQYHPQTVEDQAAYQKLEVNKNVGHFDAYNYDHISFYVGDYLAVRRTMMDTIPIVRNEKDLKQDHPEEYEFGIYGLFLRASHLHVLRAVEPNLKLIYQNIECNEESVSERIGSSCLLQQGFSFGLRSQLSKLILDYADQFKI